MRTLHKLKQLNKDELINIIYNNYVNEITSENGKIWESVDFANNLIYIGYYPYKTGVQIRPLEKFVHEYRLMTLEEINIFISYINEITEINFLHKKEKYEAIERLNNWIQGLII